jgi:hypothetical protein
MARLGKKFVLPISRDRISQRLGLLIVTTYNTYICKVSILIIRGRAGDEGPLRLIQKDVARSDEHKTQQIDVVVVINTNNPFSWLLLKHIITY